MRDPVLYRIRHLLFRLDYVYQYGHGNYRIVVVKIHPKDIVSVPEDYQYQKMRVCKYEVVANYEGELNSYVEQDEAPTTNRTITADWSFVDDPNLTPRPDTSKNAGKFYYSNRGGDGRFTKGS